MERKYILIIEDSSAQALANQYLLENRGVDILLARNGLEGIELALKHQPRVIILDVLMPGMDGFEVCRRLKSDPKTANIPIIMHTAKENAFDLMVSRQLGAVDFIPKDSFSGTVMLATLKELGIIDQSSGQDL